MDDELARAHARRRDVLDEGPSARDAPEEVVMSLFLASIVFQAAAALPPQNELDRCVQYLATELSDREGVPGIQICIRKEGVLLAEHARGVADEARGVLVTRATRFPIGSLSRIVTSAGVLQLAAEKELALSDDVGALLPELAKLAHPVRVEHLLAGTSGIASWAGLFRAAKREPASDLDRAAMLALFASAPFDFTPGTDYAPNSAAWSLLPLLLERSWGTSFARGVGPHLLAPLGLEHTSACTPLPTDAGLARDCGAVERAHDCEVALALGPAWPAPSLCSTADDVARFVELLGTGRVVDERSTARFLASVRKSDGTPTGHGFAFDLDRVAGHARAWHSGGIGGFRARVAWYPEDELVIAVLANCSTADVDALEDELGRYVLGLEPRRVLDVPIAASEVARFAADYQIATVRVRVFERAGRLVWQDAESERELAWQGRGAFRDRADAKFLVAFDLEGERAEGLTLTRDGAGERGRRLP